MSDHAVYCSFESLWRWSAWGMAPDEDMSTVSQTISQSSIQRAGQPASRSVSQPAVQAGKPGSQLLIW